MSKPSPLEISWRLEVREDALHLAFANHRLMLWLWHFIESGDISPDAFVQDLQISDTSGLINLQAIEFQNQRNLEMTARQLVSETSGRCFTALLDVVEADLKAKPLSKGDKRLDGWILIRAIRNAFSHGIGAPIWNIRLDERRLIQFGNFEIDLAAMHDTHLEHDQIGGPNAHEQLWAEWQTNR